MVKTQTEKGVVSFGLTSYGYDVRVGTKFKIFTNVYGEIIDPKNFSPRAFVEHEGDFCIIPPNSFILAETIEEFTIPRNILAICLGKSTYARCFTGDTTVALVDGTRPTFTELCERWKNGDRELYGYGFIDGQYAVQPLIEPRLVSESEETLLVKLDNGEIVECTQDHEFLTRDGERMQARYLAPGTSLLPLYLHDSHGYESIYNPLTRDWQCTHLAVEDMLVRQGVWQERVEEEELHHKDLVKRNNLPSNLQRITEADHARLHNKLKDLSVQSKTYWADPINKKWHLKRLHTPAVVRKASRSRSRFYATEEGKAVSRLARAKNWSKRGKQGRKAQAKIARGINLRTDITLPVVRRALKTAGTIRGAARLLGVDRSAFRRFKTQLPQLGSANNHKVLWVSPSGRKVPVYCLTAPDTGNFALGSGVIVSNCGLIVNVTPLEPEWKGKITIEISNTTPLPARVYANEGIAQILFLRADSATCRQSYADKGGKYQNQPGIVLPFVKT